MTSTTPTPRTEASALRELGIGDDCIALLAKVGVTHPDNLRHNNPYVLVAKLQQANDRYEITAYAPTLGTVAEWMRRARTLSSDTSR